jgi:hypothetical protein
MDTNLLVGSSFSPGREALHVLVRPDRRIDVVANDGTVVGTSLSLPGTC